MEISYACSYSFRCSWCCDHCGDAAGLGVPSARPSYHLTKAKPKVVHPTVPGVVVGVHGNKVKVLSSTATVDNTDGPQQVVTLTMTDKTRETTKGGKHPQSISGSPGSMDATGPALGTYIVATGTVTGSTLVTTAETTTVLPAEALVGQIAAMNADASQFTVTTRGHQVDGDHAEHWR